MFKNVLNFVREYDLTLRPSFVVFLLIFGFDTDRILGPRGVSADVYTTPDPWAPFINITYYKELPTYLPKSKSTPETETEDFIVKFFIPLTTTTEKSTININLEEPPEYANDADSGSSDSVTRASAEYDTFTFDKDLERTVTVETWPPTVTTTYSHVKKQPQKKTTWLRYPRVTLVAHKYAKTYFIKCAKRKWWIWNENYTTYDISGRRRIRRRLIREKHREWHSLRVERRKIPTSPKTTPSWVYIRPDYPDPYFYRINTRDWAYNTHQWNDTFEEWTTFTEPTTTEPTTAVKSKYQLRKERELLEERLKKAKGKERERLQVAERRAARMEREQPKKEQYALLKAERLKKKKERAEMIALGIPLNKTTKTHEQIAEEMARRWARRKEIKEKRMKKKGITFTEIDQLTTEYIYAVYETKKQKVLSKAEKERQDKLKYERDKKAQRDKKNKVLRRAQQKAAKNKKPAKKSGGGRVVVM